VNREEATEQILEAKKKKDLTFEAIAQHIERHKVWTTAALLGQHSDECRGGRRGRGPRS